MVETLRIMEAAGANLAIETIAVGEKVYKSGVTSGMEASSWESLRRTKVFLKAPITTPQGGGYKSLNVAVRTTLGLFANVRPFQSFHPFIETKFPGMDLVIVRENEEDLYSGIEHQQTQQVVQCLKLISIPGCEKIIRFAFEYAKAHNRKKATCFTKDNIMKQTDGLFHKIFDRIGAEYADIEKEHWIIDIGTALLATAPERFDVIVTLNLYGDIISDVAGQIAGSVGLAGSANIGDSCAMFEAIHGSAPTIAGKNIANPSGLLNGAILMLEHIGQGDIGASIQNALLATIEDGIHTGDVFKAGVSKQKVGTKEFADAIIARLGKMPKQLKSTVHKRTKIHTQQASASVPSKKEMMGIDVFLDYPNITPNDLALKLTKMNSNGLKLNIITNRGVKVYPDGYPETFCTDHWRCRFLSTSGKPIQHNEVIHLLQALQQQGLDFIKTEQLYHFDGERAYTLGQGE